MKSVTFLCSLKSSDNFLSDAPIKHYIFIVFAPHFTHLKVALQFWLQVMKVALSLVKQFQLLSMLKENIHCWLLQTIFGEAVLHLNC